MDSVVFLSLDSEARSNFEALVPLLLGCDKTNALWQTKYYTAPLTWRLQHVTEDVHSVFAGETGALQVVGYSASTPSQTVDLVLNTLEPQVVVRFFRSDDPTAEADDGPFELSLSQEMVSLEGPPRAAEAEEQERFWRSQVEACGQAQPLAVRDEDTAGLRRLFEIFDVYDWRNKRCYVSGSKSSERHKANTPEEEKGDESSMHTLDALLSQIQNARNEAQSGELSDTQRRERASDLVNQLMQMLDLGSLDI
eukprot:Gregarina_sp_Pseudo_9__2119@NODE_247_length_3444_cov_52_284581_g230_i0_p3_GENE_NODE_247_length_3444_cov_52_284581_g230_i0NODE_247_length_3444_cov_52_284581_g230_i0_p3_ORF_typecomplete_len252_score49_16Adaptin_binding/PF10199_9/6_9e07Pex19/PF04614_12/0_049DUF2630/PF10944_8/0_09sCache_2/PF17200_4/0_32_NODE_247_length_3444_cov_52_284581_g230_i0236991